ncbi:DUF2815 family protein [Patescibacteria group bacterium]|nr:DUF2815 family protein [Patescibacteria group bacterium]
MTKQNPAKVITGKCRSTFMFTEELRPDEKYPDRAHRCSTGILISKKDKNTIKAIEKAIKAAAIKKFGADIKVKSRKFDYPLHDGDEALEDGDRDGEEYKNHYYLNAKAYKIPGLVDTDAQKVPFDEREEYINSGNYYYFSIVFKGFDVDGNKGVRVEINNMMFIKEGESLDGRASAEDDFSSYGGGDDDDEDDEEEKTSRRSKRKGKRSRR